LVIALSRNPNTTTFYGAGRSPQESSTAPGSLADSPLVRPLATVTAKLSSPPDSHIKTSSRPSSSAPSSPLVQTGSPPAPPLGLHRNGSFTVQPHAPMFSSYHAQHGLPVLHPGPAYGQGSSLNGFPPPTGGMVPHGYLFGGSLASIPGQALR
jgi:hypothetical protein